MPLLPVHGVHTHFSNSVVMSHRYPIHMSWSDLTYVGDMCIFMISYVVCGDVGLPYNLLGYFGILNTNLSVIN